MNSFLLHIPLLKVQHMYEAVCKFVLFAWSGLLRSISFFSNMAR
jgi:hypothetical protein